MPHHLSDGQPSSRRTPAKWVSETARAASRWVVRLALRFVAHGMPVYAGALTYRGILALFPFALVLLWLLGVFGLEGSLPRLTGALRQLHPGEGDAELAGLLSVGAAVGAWSISVGARLLVRALNAVHEVEETRPLSVRFALFLVLLPAMAFLIAVSAAALALASRLAEWVGGLVGVGGVVDLLRSGLRFPLALAVVGLAVAVVFRFGPCARPPWRAVVTAAALTVGLWVVVSFGFGFALGRVLDYGATYGSLGAAVALLVYLHLCVLVVLLGAEASASFGRDV